MSVGMLYLNGRCTGIDVCAVSGVAVSRLATSPPEDDEDVKLRQFLFVLPPRIATAAKYRLRRHRSHPRDSRSSMDLGAQPGKRQVRCGGGMHIQLSTRVRLTPQLNHTAISRQSREDFNPCSHSPYALLIDMSTAFTRQKRSRR